MKTILNILLPGSVTESRALPRSKIRRSTRKGPGAARAGAEGSRQSHVARLQNQRLPKASQSLEVARAAYAAGTVDFINFIDAEWTLLGFQLNEVEARTHAWIRKRAWPSCSWQAVV